MRKAVWKRCGITHRVCCLKRKRSESVLCVDIGGIDRRFGEINVPYQKIKKAQAGEYEVTKPDYANLNCCNNTLLVRIIINV